MTVLWTKSSSQLRVFVVWYWFLEEQMLYLFDQLKINHETHELSWVHLSLAHILKLLKIIDYLCLTHQMRHE